MDKEMIGLMGADFIKSIVDNLENLDMGLKIRKHPLSDLPNFSYKLFVEFDSKTKVVKNLVIELDKVEIECQK